MRLFAHKEYSKKEYSKQENLQMETGAYELKIIDITDKIQGLDCIYIKAKHKDFQNPVQLNLYIFSAYYMVRKDAIRMCANLNIKWNDKQKEFTASIEKVIGKTVIAVFENSILIDIKFKTELKIINRGVE